MPQRECRARHGEQTTGRVRRPEQVGGVEVATVADDEVRATAAHLWTDQGEHRVTIGPGVGQPLHDEDHSSVCRLRRAAEFRGSGAVHGLVGQVDGTDDGGIDLPGPQGPHGEVEGDRAGGFLGADGKCRAGQVELGADPVRGDVGHAAQHTGRRERRADRPACRRGRPGVQALPGRWPSHRPRTENGCRGPG
jgi:hypothetical protein